MEFFIYAAIGLIQFIFLVSWIWLVRTVIKTSALLEEATADTEMIIEEIKEITAEATEVSRELEQVLKQEKMQPRNRRSTDRRDN